MTDNLDTTDTPSDTPTEWPEPGHESTAPIEVRRNVPLSASVGGLSALLTVAFAVRSFGGGSALDWLAFGVLSLVTIAHVASLVDSRAPLLVADRLGVRLRHGSRWQGIAWDDIDCLEHLPRRGLVRDGHLLVDGYDDEQLVVPLTLATRVAGAAKGTLSDVLADLADGRADVVEVVPGLPEDQAETVDAPGDGVPTLSDLYGEDEAVAAPTERRGIAARVAAGLMSVAPGPREGAQVAPQGGPDAVDAEEDHDPESTHPVSDAEDDLATGEIAAVAADGADAAGDAADTEDTGPIDVHEEPPAPGRPTVLPARVELDRPGVVRARVTDAAPQVAPGDTMTVVLDDLAVRPATNPVIGPQLASARERLRLTVDQLSERTRIRPHVIEAIEADDFTPCGGDFYARGHLRTLARVLGVDAAPLVAKYDDKYAHAPVDPRRVFESELATGVGGSIRGTRGGRNWSVLVAAVMAAILVWSIARLVMDGPVPIGDTPVLNQSGGITTAPTKGKPVKLALTAAGGGAQLVVRDGAGEIVFDGDLAFGQTTKLDVVPPVRIHSSDGSVTYALGDKAAAPLGETGEEAAKTLVVR